MKPHVTINVFNKIYIQSIINLDANCFKATAVWEIKEKVFFKDSLFLLNILFNLVNALSTFQDKILNAL